MAKNLNTVSLAFTANTNEAIVQIKRLQKELNQLATGAPLKNGTISQLTPEIQKAMVAAGELQAKLEHATNLKTGKLDLTQFSDSLKKGGVSLQEYANQLNALGPQGRKAFTTLAQSIIQAEAPLIRCSNKLKEFGTTLANTARWQISSSILHSFMGTIQSAYGYAQDLNASLNDIRIVTGQNVDQMAAFADRANKAAKALSTTTNEYAKAALIYYQQGDSDADVLKKTDITVKMANVTGQSADTVSDQLTAIWNNFNAAGEESYERFADILTALGAATASSTDEIAGGLEKFAAIGETIGLSYEYAASALATITAKTRQSEDVVGTALKTIFARIQGLKQGDTLDDGTSLNKYSEALRKVGIDIFDTSGQLKDMDNILDEMGAKWKTLAKDQQLALAQTVAGVRQYNQLVSLMDEWDFMEENLELSYNAEGTLQEQADIYAESWEAARDRVTASAEDIYTKILDDDFFIDFLNGFSKAIDGVGSLIDAFGGLKGVLLTVGAFATRLFHDEITKGLRNTMATMKQLTPWGKAENEKTKSDAVASLRSLRSQSKGQTQKAENAALDREVSMQEALLKNAKRLSEEDIKQLQIQMDLVRSIDERAIAAAKAADEAAKELQTLQKMNRLHAQLADKKRLKAGAEKEWAKNLMENAQPGKKAGSEKEFIYSQKVQAENKVREAHGLAGGEDISDFQDEVESAFIQGIQEAASAEISNTFAKKLAKDLKEKVAQSIHEGLKESAKKVKNFDKAIETAAKAEVAGKRLDTTTERALTDLSNAGGDPEKIKTVQDTIQKEIQETIKCAKELQEAMGGEGTDIDLDNAISELDMLRKKLDEGTLNAEELKKILEQINSINTDTSNTFGGTIAVTAGVKGVEFEQDGNDAINMPGEVDFTGHYQAAVKKREKEVENDDATGNSEKVFGDYNKKLADKGGVTDWADRIANATNVIMSLGSAITSVQGAIDTFNNPDASAWDKVSAGISVVVGVLPVVTSLFSAAAGPIGWITLAVGALTAAFITLAVAMHKASPKGQFEAAQKAAEDAEKAAVSVKSEYEELINTLDGLDDGIKKIEELERGTLEWRQAIIESNNALIELLSTYGMLDSKNFTVDDDGVMHITEDAKQKLIEQQTKAVQAANVANYGAEIVKNEKEFNSQSSETAGGLSLIREQQIATPNGGTSTVYYDALTKNSQLSADVGKAVGEALSEGRLDSDDLTGKGPNGLTDLTNVLSKVNGLYGDEAAALANQIAGSKELMFAFNELGASATKTAEANRILGDQIIETNFGDQIKNSELDENGQQKVTDMLAKAFTDEQEKLYNDTYKDGKGLSDKTVQEQYAEAMGWATDTIKNQTGNKATYYRKDGKEVGTISDEVARRYLAQQAATEKTKDNVQDYIDSLDKLISTGDKIQKGIGDALSSFAGGTGGDLGSLNKSQLENLKGTVSEVKDDQFTIGTGEDAVVIDQEYAEKLGYETVQEYYDAINNEIKNAEDNLSTDKIAESMGVIGEFGQKFNTAGSSFKDLFNEIDFDGITAQGKKDFANTYKTIFEEGGKEGLELIKKILSGAGDNVVQVAELIGSIDWSSIESADGFKEKLAALGIELKGVDVDSFIASMKDMHDATSDYGLSGFKEDIKNINEIAKDAKLGDIISAEDYEKLGEGFDKYFTLMADGTYKLTGDAEEFYNAVMKNSRDKLLEAIKADISNNEKDVNQYNAAKGVLQNTSMDDIRKTYTSEQLRNDGDLSSNVESQIDFIEQMQGASKDQIAAWRSDLETNGNASDRVLKAISETANACADSFNELGSTIDSSNQKIYDSMQAYLTSATSLADLNTSVSELESSLGISLEGTDLYSNALINLATQYENCSSEVRDYKEALSSGNKETVEAAEKTLKLSIRTGELAKKYNLDAKTLETQAKLLKQNSKNLKLTEEQAVELAAANQRMNKGISTLSKNWSTWNKTLKTAKSTSSDYAEAMLGLRETLVEITGALDDSAIPIDFFDKSTKSGAEHLALMGRAAKGDVQAINLLGNAVGALTIKNMEFNQEIANSAMKEDLFDMSGFKNAEAAFNNYKTEVLEGVTALETAIKNGTLKAGDDVASLMDGTGASWVDSLNQMALATGMSVEEMNSLLNQLGVQAEVDVKNVEQDMEVPTYTEVVEKGSSVEVQTGVDANGNPQYATVEGVKRYTVPGPPQKVKGWVQVAQIKAEGNDGVSSTPKVTWTGTSGSNGPGVSPSSTAKKGSGGGSKKKAEKTKKSDVVERYKEVNDRLDETERKANKAERDLANKRGKDQEEAIQNLLDSEKDKIADFKIKRNEAKTHRKADKKDLNKEASKLNLNLKYDDKTGNITNYTTELTKAYKKLKEMEKKAGSEEWSQKDANKIEKYKTKIENLEAARKKYEETNKTVKDLNDNLDEMKGKYVLPKAASDLVDIFREANEELDKLNRKLKDADRNADSSTGAKRIQYLKEAAKLEKDISDNAKSQQTKNADDIKDKRADLEEVAKKSGLTLTFDTDGSITNYDDQMEKLTEDLETKRKEYSKNGVTEAEQKILDDLEAEIGDIENYATKYEEAVKKGRDLVEEEQEALIRSKEKMATALSETLELKIEINDRDLQKIDYYLNKMGDDFYRSAEAAAFMSGKFSISQSSLEAYKSSIAEWDAKLDTEEVGDAQYLEAMKKISDGIYDTLGNINELDAAMMSYYGDTLAAAGEEIAKYTSQMEHQNSVLEHYSSIMSIMGKSTDYKKMETILKGQSSVLKDQVSAAKSTLEFYQGEAADRLTKYNEAVAAKNEEAAEMYKKQYLEAMEEANNAEEEYLSKTEAYAESLTAIFENKLAELGQTLENALAGGTSFESLNNQLSRAASIQENYLTTTNQIYETTKLMRTAQQEIDKTSNTVAKNKLKQFITETEQMQNQNKLSKYELDIQQAKYDLLLAEIAVEEAQNAKSTVRLQRDQEGNFGYVYTADASQIAEAEQKLADSQNKLYNLGLEGANDYVNKYQQTMSEMYDALNQLNEKYRSGEIESETEFNEEILAAKEYYYAKLEEYSSLYSIAVQTDSNVIADAWSSQFGAMISNTATWKTEVNKYIDEITGAFKTWKGEMATIETDLKLGDVNTAVNTIKQTSSALLTELTKENGVIDKVSEELALVKNVTDAWAGQRATIQGLVGDYEILAGSIDETIKTMLSLQNSGEKTETPTETPSETTGLQTMTTSTEVGKYVPIKSGTKLYQDPQGTKEVGEAGNVGTIKAIDTSGDYSYNIDGLGWIKKTDIIGYDTGGYTGDWNGSYGKMAFLHQKEIVLNADDTANFLMSLEVLNKIVDAIDLHATNAQLGGLLSSSPYYNTAKEETVLEQQVHIEASFPSVTNHSELEEAFNNLINQASQYANRK